jgi:hypothetical protein
MNTDSSMPRGRYRPRLERAPETAPSIEITERDLAVLALLAEHRVLTQGLVEDALECSGPRPSPTNLSKRLAAMFHGGYLDRILPPRRETFTGGAAFAYALTAKSERLLRSRQFELPFPAGANWKRRNEKLSQNPPFTRHTLMVARFRITLDRALPAAPSLVLATSERENPELQHTWNRGGRRCRVVPDAFFELGDRDASGRAPRAFFVELDRATMESRRMRAKLDDFAFLERDGLAARVFGVRDFVVLLVAENAARASFLLDLAANPSPESPAAALRPRILVTSEQAYAEHPTNLLAQIWRSAAKPDERAAIIPSPLPRR